MTERQTFCIYCQHEYGTPQALRKHIERKHPGTYADTNVNKEYSNTLGDPTPLFYEKLKSDE